MLSVILSMAISLFALTVNAAERPGDSVVSGKFKTSTTFNVSPSPPAGYSKILDRVALSSQKKPNTFVRYGPFQNLGKVNLEISVDRVYSWGEHTLVGMIDGQEVASHPAYIQFSVAPGRSFYIQIKGTATISAAATLPDLSPEEVGLPHPEDFTNPRGKFLHCIDMPAGISNDGRIYFYEEGSMSDKSHSYDMGMSLPGYTTGVAPPYPVDCQVFQQPE